MTERTMVRMAIKTMMLDVDETKAELLLMPFV